VPRILPFAVSHGLSYCMRGGVKLVPRNLHFCYLMWTVCSYRTRGHGKASAQYLTFCCLAWTVSSYCMRGRVKLVHGISPFCCLAWTVCSDAIDIRGYLSCTPDSSGAGSIVASHEIPYLCLLNRLVRLHNQGPVKVGCTVS
jgi:hypothetical protein